MPTTETPLLMTIRYDSIETVDILLCHPADLDDQSSGSGTALTSSLSSHGQEASTFLLDLWYETDIEHLISFDRFGIGRFARPQASLPSSEFLNRRA